MSRKKLRKIIAESIYDLSKYRNKGAMSPMNDEELPHPPGEVVNFSRPEREPPLSRPERIIPPDLQQQINDLRASYQTDYDDPSYVEKYSADSEEHPALKFINDLQNRIRPSSDNYPDDDIFSKYLADGDDDDYYPDVTLLSDEE